MTTSLSVKNQSLTEGQTVLASSFFTTLPAGATLYAVDDLGGDGGYFMLGAQKLTRGVLYDLTPAQMAQLQYVAGSGVGSEQLNFQALINGVWTSVAPSKVTITAPVTTTTKGPVLTGQNVTIDEGQSIGGASLIKSIVNRAGASTTQYAFTDNGGDGHLLLNGVALTTGKVYDLTAAQLAQLTYVGGATTGTDSITIQSYDGSIWSNSVNVTVTVAPPPVVTVNNEAIVTGQTITGSSLIAGVVDAAGAAITQYAFMNSGADGGQLFLNGVALAKGVWTTLTAAQLSQLTYVAGSSAGTDSISIKVFDGQVWSSVAVATITQASFLNSLTDAGVKADVTRLMVNNSLSYASMLTILKDAEAGGMSASKFASLQVLSSELNKSGGVTTSAYVQQITQDVINGNSANAFWNGGSATAVALGNLTAASTQTQVTELVGKWFLGTDLPSANVSSVGITAPTATYKVSTSALFGASGSASYLDVNQGSIGDCYFMSSLGEVALQDSTGIPSMITANGNGTYAVRFMVNGQADYVTVDAELPNMPAGYAWANGSSLEFANGNVLWPELLEKAYAQLNQQTNAPHGASLNAASDSYAGIDAGPATALTEITGQSVTSFNLNASTSSATLSSDNTQLAAAFASKEELLMSTPGATNGNLIGSHMFEVVGFTSNASNPLLDVITLHNPWGSAYSGSTAMTFTETIGQLAADNCALYMTTGKPIA